MHRQLPRSLAPLPAESLSGYVLRMAHRCFIAPRDVAAALGFETTAANPLPTRLMFEMGPDLTERFAYCARLSADEIHALTYVALRRTYPPVDPDAYLFHGVDRLRHLVSSETWVFVAASRYCPLCLAGDGSEIEEEHGGAWDKHWRLAVVFGCLRHQRLLASACPVCARPAMSNNPRYRGQLVPLATKAGLYPLACRSEGEGRATVCSGRYDQAETPAGSELGMDSVRRLFDLQQRLAELLAADSAAVPRSLGRPVTPAEYFTDLRLAAGLISRALRASKTPTIPCVDAQGHQEFVAEMRAYLDEPARREGESARMSHHATALGLTGSVPLDAAACGSLLALAADLLHAPDPRDMAERIVAMAGTGLDARNRLSTATARNMPCSAGMREAVAAAFTVNHTITLAATWRRRLDELAASPSISPRFEARHIPQRALDAWWERYFCHLTHHDVRFTRNMRLHLSTRLAAAAQGCTLSAAGDLLEIPATVCVRTSISAARALEATGSAAFHAALDALIAELNQQTHQTDYAHRRLSLHEWRLDDQTWKNLCNGLDLFRDRIAEQVEADQEDKRLLATIFVWTHVTNGDYLLAPVITPQPNALWESPRHPMRIYVRERFRALSRASPQSAHGALASRLRAFADRLASKIDAAA